GRGVVGGGGVVGVEVAEILRARGLAVTFVIRENWYFPLALDEREAGLVGEHLRAHGCDVRLGLNVEAVERGPDGGLSGVRLAGGESVPFDIAGSALGVVPPT